MNSLVTAKDAPKRTTDQKEHHRYLISAWIQKGYNSYQIRDMIAEETGIELSVGQVGSDIRYIRDGWMKRHDINYSALIVQEMARLDSLETELWARMRDSATPKVRSVIERWAKGVNLREMSEAELDGLAAKITETTEAGSVDPRYFSLIADAQKERRRLLGLYAPETKNINQKVLIKGYKEVSPSDWDTVAVEGEYSSGD